MTREEAIVYGKRVIGLGLNDETQAFCELAIEALEQEPCEDAISRQAVIDTIYHECSGENLDIDFAKVLLLQRKIKTLQSVNPQKLGHWIADVDKWGDVVTTVNGYRCDQCNTFNADKDNYCPNCGAKMIESEDDNAK